MHKRRWAFFLLTASTLAVCILTPLNAWAPLVVIYERSIAPGLVFRQELFPASSPQGPLAVHIFDVDTTSPDLKIIAALGGDTVWDNDPTLGREIVTKLAERRQSLAAVNASFFPFAGNPIGLHMEDGNIITEPMKNRSSFLKLKSGDYAIAAYTFSGKIICGDVTVPLSGINRKPDSINENIAFTRQFGKKTLTLENRDWLILDAVGGSLTVGGVVTSTTVLLHQRDVDITSDKIYVAMGPTTLAKLRKGLQQGLPVTIKCVLTALEPEAPPATEIVDAVTGAPRILTNKAVTIQLQQEQMSESFSTTRHPRTAIGIRANGSVLIITVDGRRPAFSKGATLDELSQMLIAHGAVQGLNLDGGGSSVAVARGLVLNAPSDGSQRPVADALLIQGPSFPSAVALPSFPSATPKSVKVAQSVLLFAMPTPNTNHFLWGTDGVAGFIDQSGFFTGMKAGSTKVTLANGKETVSSTMQVIDSKTPADPANPLRN